MKNRNYLAVLLTVVLVSVTSESSAQTSWYVGYGIGQSDSEYSVDQFGAIPVDEQTDAQFDKEGDTRRISIGYNADARLSYEAGLLEFESLGAVEDYTLLDGSVVSGLTDVEGYYVAAVSKYSASQTITVTGRLGYYLWDMTSTQTRTGLTIDPIQEDDGDFFYGIGMEIAWFGLEYDIYDIGGKDVKYVGATLKYTFK